MRGLVILNYNDSLRVSTLANKCINEKIFDVVVVVDNASNDENLKLLKNNLNNEVVLLKNNQNLGFGKGTNVGLKYLVECRKLEHVYITNSDIIFTKELVDKCDVALLNKGFSAISTLNYENDGSIGTSYWDFPQLSYYMKWMLYLYRRKHPANILKVNKSDYFETDVLRGSFVGFNSEVLKSVNYFDEETFMYFEENCIFRKFRINGYKVGVINNCYYIHDHLHKPGLVNPKLLKWNHQSAYHYFTKYDKINFLNRFIFKCLIHYSMFEVHTINFVKRLIKGKRGI